MVVRLGVAVAFACGALAADAHAASVSLVDTGPVERGVEGYALSFTARPGEPNRLTMSQSAETFSWTVRDAGAPLVPGANCAAAPDATVTCAVEPAPTLNYSAYVTTRVDLGDSDDTAEISTQSRDEIDMGSGDDALILHAGSGTASLGAGRDTAAADAGVWGGTADRVPTRPAHRARPSSRRSTARRRARCRSASTGRPTTARPARATTSARASRGSSPARTTTRWTSAGRTVRWMSSPSMATMPSMGGRAAGSSTAEQATTSSTAAWHVTS